MTFFQCLKREALWWFRSPSLWWCMPLLLVAVSLQPHFLWWGSGLKVKDLEGLWIWLAYSWNSSGREMLQSNGLLMMAVGKHFAELNRLMTMPIEELWKNYLIPPLQLFALLPLSMLVPPFAVTVFRRDIDHGAYKAYRLNGGSLMNFLTAKFAVQAAMLAPIQLLSMILALYLYSMGSGRAALFSLSDPIWWWCWMGLGLGLGLWTIVASWLMCLITHNGCTEVYTALIVSLLAGMLCLGSVRLWGWNVHSMLGLSAFLILTIPLMLLVLGCRMRSANYLFR